MKRLLPFVLAVVLSTGIIGCNSKVEANNDRMILITMEIHGGIYYDSETGVEYWISNAMYNCGDMTMLVKADGTPLIYGKDER